MSWKHIGMYPPEYNPKIHGPYDPSRFYGKPDTPFGEVKISELPGWLARRNKNPIAWGSAVGRAWWRWQDKWMFPKKAGMAGYFQIVVGTMIFFYTINYGKTIKHRNYKYHW